MTATSRTNWSGNIDFAASALETPGSVAELQACVSRHDAVRALGTAHCFNGIAATRGVQIQVTGLDSSIDIDSTSHTAWVPAAMKYGELAKALQPYGFAVRNIASLGHISVAGAVITGTHGSGDANGTLSSTVRALELVTAAGDLVVIDESSPDFCGSVVSLGMLGVVTRVRISIVPAFDIAQTVIDDVPHAQVTENFDAIFSSAYGVSFFTTWGPENLGQIWVKHLADHSWRHEEWMGGTPATIKCHPLPGHDPIHCTEQLGVVGPSYERLPHFKLEFTPSSGDELQTEYLVPRTEAVQLLQGLLEFSPRIHELLHVSEIRTMAADDLWLSGASGRDTVGIHFTWKKVPEVFPLLPVIDEYFAPAGGRPHWGKLFDATALPDRYSGFGNFVDLVERYDPSGKFSNDWWRGVLGGG
jgi:xylitol oxidase